jgi:hypothetical protein
VALIHLSSLIGRTFDETLRAYNTFGDDKILTVYSKSSTI